MSKTQFICNVIFFIPLLVLNFFAYGVDGCARLFDEINRYSKKYLVKKSED